MTKLQRADGMLHVDCNKYRCRITGQDGFEITILDDLTSIIKKNSARVHTQTADSIGDQPAATRLTILLI